LHALGTDEQKETMRAFLTTIVPFGEAEAMESARLSTRLTKSVVSEWCSMIAGTASAAKARLAISSRHSHTRILHFFFLTAKALRAPRDAKEEFLLLEVGRPPAAPTILPLHQ